MRFNTQKSKPRTQPEQHPLDIKYKLSLFVYGLRITKTI